MQKSDNRFQVLLLLMFSAFMMLCLRDSPYELHAAIHVIPTWIAVAVLLFSTRRFPLSSICFTFVIAFLALHMVGTRYVYSFVPYDQWSSELLGASISESLGLSRNHYDRFVHFNYGLLIAPVAREIQLRLFEVSRRWSYLTAIEFIMASSMLFELAEWLGAVWLAPDMAESYLGQQGDAWDAHKDMGLAAAGACLSMTVAGIISYRKSSQSSLTDVGREGGQKPI